MTTLPVQYARSADGTNIGYTVSGDGPPLLILGSLGLTIGYMRPWHLSLAYDFKHVVYDRRGSGSSSSFTSASMPQLLQDASAVVDHAGFSSFHIFGFAMGCVEAIRLALKCPERVRGLLLVNPVAPDWTAEPMRKAWRASLEADWDYFADTMVRTAGTPEQPPSVEHIRQFKESNNAEGFRGVVTALADASQVDLAQLSVPVVVVHGTYWGRDVGNIAKRHAAEIPGAKLVADRSSDAWRLSAETEEVLRDFFIETLPADEVPLAWRAAEPLPTDLADHASLSAREREVLRLLAVGHSNKQIADALTISIATVATHLRHIFEKLGVENRAGAAAWAVREGLA